MPAHPAAVAGCPAVVVGCPVVVVGRPVVKPGCPVWRCEMCVRWWEEETGGGGVVVSRWDSSYCSRAATPSSSRKLSASSELVGSTHPWDVNGLSCDTPASRATKWS